MSRQWNSKQQGSHQPAHERAEQLIGGEWRPGGGDVLSSHEPATGTMVWEAAAASPADIDAAVAAARGASRDWAARPVEERIAILRACSLELKAHGELVCEAICRETGKPRWEAAGEVTAMVTKVETTIDAWRERQQDHVDDQSGDITATRYRPHGVLVVLGPFNFPGHIPQGQIVPALLAGNAVVFKPSELTPLVGRRLVEIWQGAGLPAGVLNLVQGGRDTGSPLISHPGIDGVLFTGSYATGVALGRAFAAEPGKILALEMGGNNPLVVHAVENVDAAATLTILSAFISAGQRCSCARRLIVPDSPGGEAFLAHLVPRIAAIRVGLSDDSPQPFMGPVIHEAAAKSLRATQDDLLARGGVALRRMESLRGIPTLLSPGLIDVTAVAERGDGEWFGPLLQLIRVHDFDAAIDEANRTAYGLTAALLSDEKQLYERFRDRVRAGVVNWNRQTTGASPGLPFGGIGRSGNHRPGGAFMIDSCAYPVASLERQRLVCPPPSPGLD
jgi:succinylglutamic semialdehyde dehydrogenase